MVAPAQPFARARVGQAVNQLNSAATDAASQAVAYAGEAARQNAIIRTLDTTTGVLSLIEDKARAAADAGATAVQQAAAGTRVAAEAQRASALLAQADAIAGLLPQSVAQGQEAAAGAAEQVAEGFRQYALAQTQAAINSLINQGTQRLGRSAPCNGTTIRSFSSIPVTGRALMRRIFSASTGGFHSFQPRQNVKVDRSNAKFTIEIDGKRLDDSYQRTVEKILVTETSDHSISKMEIFFFNEANKFTNDEIWDRHKKIRIWMGYPTTGLTHRGNTFYSMGPRIIYPSNGGERRIVLLAYGEEFRLGRTQKRRTWQNQFDHGIAAAIAAEYGWDIDADSTPTRYEHVAQVNESDWKFLDRRARYYGYQVFVDHWRGDEFSDKGILHFHAPRYRTKDISMTYMNAQDSQLNGFVAWETPLQYGQEVVATQVDPLTKEIFRVQSSNYNFDDISAETMGNFKEGTLVTSSSIARLPGEFSRNPDSLSTETPTVYMLEEGHRQNSLLLGNETQGFSESTRWLVQGEGSVIGLETMRVGDVVKVMGIGRDSGEYYIKELVTTIKTGMFDSNFSVARTWRGNSRGTIVGKTKKIEPQKLGEFNLAQPPNDVIPRATQTRQI